MKRREFLNLSLQTYASFLATQLFSQIAGADMLDPNVADFLLIITMDGGWDTSVGLDPWTQATRPDVKDLFLDYSANEVITKGNLSIGPAMKSMTKYMDRFSVVRGILCSEIETGHQAPRDFMASGDSSGKNGSLALEFEDSGQATTLGAIVKGVYRGQSSALSTDLSQTPTLKAPDKQQMSMASVGKSVLQNIMSSASDNSTLLSKFTNCIADLQKKHPVLNDGHYIGATFASGLSRSSSISLSDISLGLDTHSGHPTVHRSIQTACWDRVSAMLDALQEIELSQGLSVLDRTTVYILSEFDRTPALDEASGTNHNPLNNNALLMGPRIKANMSFGFSHLVPAALTPNNLPVRMAAFLDKTSFQKITSLADGKKNGLVLSPENVIATLIESLGIPRTSSALVPLSVESISSLLKV